MAPYITNLHCGCFFSGRTLHVNPDCGEHRQAQERERETLRLMTAAPARKPSCEQSGIADLPLFGTIDLFNT